MGCVSDRGSWVWAMAEWLTDTAESQPAMAGDRAQNRIPIR